MRVYIYIYIYTYASIHPYVFFGWLGDKKGVANAAEKEQNDKWNRERRSEEEEGEEEKGEKDKGG